MKYKISFERNSFKIIITPDLVIGTWMAGSCEREFGLRQALGEKLQQSQLWGYHATCQSCVTNSTAAVWLSHNINVTALNPGGFFGWWCSSSSKQTSFLQWSLICFIKANANKFHGFSKACLLAYLRRDIFYFRGITGLKKSQVVYSTAS